MQLAPSVLRPLPPLHPLISAGQGTQRQQLITEYNAWDLMPGLRNVIDLRQSLKCLYH